MAKVDADNYRILNANVALLFKPFSFVKDSVVGEIMNNEVSFWHVQPNLTTDDCSSAATPLVTGSVNTS